MLTRVTFTGADDCVDPLDLLDISEAYPFVEWGVLFSGSKRGESRYPTDEWSAKLISAIERWHVPVALAAHFCGQFTRDTMSGDASWLKFVGKSFERVQINGFKPQEAAALISLSRSHNFEFILQTRVKEDLPKTAEVAAQMPAGRVSALYDPSGGSGIVTYLWPEHVPGLTMGFAGGIGPHNVLAVLENIGDRPEPFWIDMESGVRTKDRFDLEKVQEVLRLCEPLVGKPYQEVQP